MAAFKTSWLFELDCEASDLMALMPLASACNCTVRPGPDAQLWLGGSRFDGISTSERGLKKRGRRSASLMGWRDRKAKSTAHARISRLKVVPRARRRAAEPLPPQPKLSVQHGRRLLLSPLMRGSARTVRSLVWPPFHLTSRKSSAVANWSERCSMISGADATTSRRRSQIGWTRPRFISTTD
jgi:hypothetical protein